MFIPESPVFLCRHNRLDEAKTALQKLRGNDINVDGELLSIQMSLEREKDVASVGIMELFANRIYLLPFLLGLFGMFNFQMCGVNIIFFYLNTIFTKAGSSIDPGKKLICEIASSLIGLNDYATPDTRAKTGWFLMY